MPNGIQHPGQPGLQSLQRHDFEAGPLGHVGNLRFRAAPGATPRTTAPNALQRFGQFMSRLAFYVTASPGQRAQQFMLDQARDNSRRIGNLLGNLTAPPGDPQARSRLAQGLARLSDLSGGDLSSLPGGQESLKTYLGELGVDDLVALRSGVLGDPEARQALLDRVDPPRLRAQAARVLDQVVAALDRSVAGQAVQEPLGEIRAVLSRRPVDGAALDAPLARLSANLAMLGTGLLDVHLQTLSDAELKALQMVLHPDRLDDTLVTGRTPQDQDMLAGIGEALDRTIQARIDQTHPELFAPLQTALTQGEPGGIARALFGLNQPVQELTDRYGVLPSGTTAGLRAQTAQGMDALRDVESNPEGPLSRPSLARLDDLSLGLLRRCSELRPFGLKLDGPGARAEGLARVQALSQRVEQGMGDLVHALSHDPLDMAGVVRQLRDLSELELQRAQRLGDLGHYSHMAGVDDRKDMIRTAFQSVLNQLEEQDQGDVARRVLDRMNVLLSLEGAFGGAAHGLSDAIADPDFVRGATEAVKRLSTTHHMLEGITSVIDERLTEENGGVDPQVKEIDLPDEFLRALQEQYGVRYDPDTVTSSLPLTDLQWSRFTPYLEAPIDPGIHPTRSIVLPVGDTEQTFPVSVAFFKDGIERPSVSLSVRGSGPEGGMVRTNWPEGAGLDTRDQAMGEALDALFKVAGPAAEPLTRMMNQQLGGGILKGLMDLGQDSPFKLDDGTVVMPSGTGRFHFDIDKRLDGDFRVVGTMTIPIEQAITLDQKGLAVPGAPMDPALSWVQVQVTLNVSPDGLQFRMSEQPQCRHHFVLLPQDPS